MVVQCTVPHIRISRGTASLKCDDNNVPAFKYLLKFLLRVEAYTCFLSTRGYFTPQHYTPVFLCPGYLETNWNKLVSERGWKLVGTVANSPPLGPTRWGPFSWIFHQQGTTLSSHSNTTPITRVVVQYSIGSEQPTCVRHGILSPKIIFMKFLFESVYLQLAS